MSGKDTTMHSTTPHSPQHDTDHPEHGPHGRRARGPGRRGQRDSSEGHHRHGGFGPGPFGPAPFSPRRSRGFGPAGPRGRRARRGDVRAAILSLLAQSPANGYALIQAITEHSDGAWKPSPGSVYPTLAQLVDEGLITPVDTVAPRSDYQLTDSGRAYVSEHADELAATWDALTEHGPLDATGELLQATHKLLGVLRQYASETTSEQQRAAATKLDELRREFYRTLAE
jgi:DNA-binding PadR family transcriptional regulator